MNDGKPPREPTVIGIRLFGKVLALKGKAAVAFLVIVPILAIALVVRFAVTNPVAFESALSSPLWISAALWILMMVYWKKAAKRSAAVQSSESAASRARHQLLLNVALLLAFVRFPFTGARWLPASPLVAPIGLAVQVGSMLLDVWAMRCLGRNWSGVVAIKVDHQLIRSGPYRLVRHPIYTAMLGMYLGTAIVSGEVHGLLGFILSVIAYARKTRMEERGLRETFGLAYDDYARVTAALIPWIL